MFLKLYDINKKSVKISGILRLQRMASYQSPGICQFGGKFRAYHKFCRGSENQYICIFLIFGKPQHMGFILTHL